jgi:KDO2-lipid IV(A) lauroyltransferase
MTRFRDRVRHRLEYLLVLAARVLDRILGPRRSAALATAIGRFVYHRLRIRAKVVESQLRAAFPERDESWVREMAQGAYEHLAREAMMMIRLSRLGREEVLRVTYVPGLDDLRGALEEGTGAIIFAGHLGNWEIGGAALAARGIPFDAVARSQENPIVDRLINEGRARLGMTIIPMGDATKGSLRGLRAGHVVALIADQDARQRGLFVPFFGRPASTYRGPALLAIRSGAPVFAAASVRQPDGRYRVRLRLVPMPEVDDPDRLEWELTARLAAELESAVREDPAQYLWHHRRWKTSPPEPVVDPGDGKDEGNGEGYRSV